MRTCSSDDVAEHSFEENIQNEIPQLLGGKCYNELKST